MQEMILIKSFARSLNSAIEYNVGSVAGSHSQAPSLQLSAPLSLSTMTPMVIQLIMWLTLITFIIYVVNKLRARNRDELGFTASGEDLHGSTHKDPRRRLA